MPFMAVTACRAALYCMQCSSARIRYRVALYLIMLWKLILLTPSRMDWIHSGLIRMSFLTKLWI